MESSKKEAILEEVMIEHGDDLVRLAFNYVKDKETAKDMVQNTFIKCYEHLDTFRNDASLKTWLYRITINQCKDYLRSWHYRMVKSKNVLESTIRAFTQSPDENVIQDSEAERVKDAIHSLPKNYSEVIYLYYYKYLSIPEISEVTGLNRNTVKTRLKRARQKLKILMKEADIYG